MKRKIIKVLASILVLCILASFVPVPVYMNKTLPGVIYNQNEAGNVTPETMTVKGWHRVYLLPFFKKNNFTGTITFGDFTCPFTKYARLTFTGGRVNFAGVDYYDEKENKFVNLGMLIMEDLYDEVFLFIHHDDFKEDTVFAAPARTRRQGEEIGEELFYDD